MKIFQLVSNYHRVAPSTNMAIYSHVAWLTNGLVERGHQVNLFASGDSETKANLFSSTPTALCHMGNINESLKRNYLHLLISKCYALANQTDIIHAHFSLSNLFLSDLVRTPTVQSIHSPITPDQKKILENFKTRRFISFSLAQRKQMPELNWIANIYHGIDTGIFAFNPTPQNYFLYLGRITEEKGVHLAIEAAKKAGVSLIIAGHSYPTEGYWHSQIEPHIDGNIIRYVGEADFNKKIEWLMNAKALLMPVQWDEPFGMVMIEAMSCGTPVIAFKRGSIPEVVQEEKSGFIVENTQDMAEAIKNIDKISRVECRKRAERFFSIEKMVNGYIKIYQRVTKEHKYRQKEEPYHNLIKILSKYFKI